VLSGGLSCSGTHPCLLKFSLCEIATDCPLRRSGGIIPLLPGEETEHKASSDCSEVGFKDLPEFPRVFRGILPGFSTCFYFSGTVRCSISHFPSLAPIFFSTRRDVRILDKSLLAGSFSTYILPTVFNVLFQNGGILSFDLFAPFFAP